MRLRYTIPLPPVTKKNHQQIMYNARTGKRFVKPSPQYEQYAEAAIWFLRPSPPEPISKPVNVKCLFYLKTRRKTDLVNLLQAVDDILVSAGILADDNYGIVAGHDGSRAFVDANNPRTESEIIDADDWFQVYREWEAGK